VAARVGLSLDPTYTAKAFASALDLARGEQGSLAGPARVLYWHTLSVASGGPAPNKALPPELAVCLSLARPIGSRRLAAARAGM